MPAIKLRRANALDAYALRSAAKYILDLDIGLTTEEHDRLWDMAYGHIEKDVAPGYRSDVMSVLTIALVNRRTGENVVNALRELGAIIEEEDDAGAED